ncbi:MAG: superoxide dismutase [Bacteroidales bacterium]
MRLILFSAIVFSTISINAQQKQIMKFELPKLNYESNALEPVISQKTIEFHYGKHHQTYVNNLNNFIQGTEFENADLETIIKNSEGPIFNNAAQVWNHTFYFNSLSPKGGGVPKGALAEAINKKWGSFDEFKKEFNQAAVTLFGSGWAWLVKNSKGELEITKEPNAGNPMTKGLHPILTFDVWEHAYYLDYQNRRPDHINEIWKLIDWNIVGSRF